MDKSETKRGRLRWFGQFECEDIGDWIKQCMAMGTQSQGIRHRRCPKKTRRDCVKDDMTCFDL